jgi:biotin-dependent carboxylase-like uncharacterized protein
MSIHIINAGLQTMVQAGPRRGLRHSGVPASGAADPLSLALANKLVGNTFDTPALEAALVGPSIQFSTPTAFALAGAIAEARLNGAVVQPHKTQYAGANDELDVSATKEGARIYIAIAGGIVAEDVLGSPSTYAPAGLGGHRGRALRDGDTLSLVAATTDVDSIETPWAYRPPVSRRRAIRVCRSAETDLLTDQQRAVLFNTNWSVGRRADRMGVALEGGRIDIEHDGRMPSVPVFPGTIQCPNEGVPYLLGIDSGTTGGYPRVAQVARLDRHTIGQLRPGDHLALLPRTPEEACAELEALHDYWRPWLPDIEGII